MADACLVLTGATATGKSALAVAVAEALDGEIISMDSRQVYRRMDIGTAKPEPDVRARIPHHGLDLVDPNQRYSAGRFARDARRWVSEIRDRGHVPILVGGTGFFLRALLEPLFEEPPMSAERRDALRHVLSAWPNDRLLAALRLLDPATAGTLEERGGGRQRMLRALEVALLTGRPLSWWQANAPGTDAGLRPLIFVLELSRSELYRRIDARVHRMIDQGLMDEVRALLACGYGPTDPGLTATGYKEVIAHLQGETTLEEAIVRIQRATRRYARRQLTWFRRQLPGDAIRLDGGEPEHTLVGAIVKRWREEGAR